jgi:transcriptional regulator with XRE-family HTH domain
MTREQLAPRLGVTYSWLCKFMQGHRDARNPRIGTLAKVQSGLAELERKPANEKRPVGEVQRGVLL